MDEYKEIKIAKIKPFEILPDSKVLIKGKIVSIENKVLNLISLPMDTVTDSANNTIYVDYKALKSKPKITRNMDIIVYGQFKIRQTRRNGQKTPDFTNYISAKKIEEYVKSPLLKDIKQIWDPESRILILVSLIKTWNTFKNRTDTKQELEAYFNELIISIHAKYKLDLSNPNFRDDFKTKIINFIEKSDLPQCSNSDLKTNEENIKYAQKFWNQSKKL